MRKLIVLSVFIDHVGQHHRMKASLLLTALLASKVWISASLSSVWTPASRIWTEIDCFKGPWVCVEHALPMALVSDIKRDAQILRATGFGSSVGVVSQTSDYRRGVHQIWLQSPGSPPLQTLLGDVPARQSVCRFIEELRNRISRHWEGLSPDEVELSYLSYEPGAYYRKHVDSSPGLNQRRVVSFLLYLGGNNDEPWEAHHGGLLRIYEIDDSTVDILPKAGTLILFDSTKVYHEVTQCLRDRTAVVGWFGKSS